MDATVLGIDYGSKVAGTTVAVWAASNVIHIAQSTKKQDADQWLLPHVQQLRSEFIYIDAPLSLPGRLVGLSGFEDYFYRVGDKAVKAMSPMFIGGLTARAIQFRDNCIGFPFVKGVYEVYPGGSVRYLDLFEGRYKQDIKSCALMMSEFLADLDLQLIPDKIENWHQLDACLSFWIGVRHVRGKAQTIGDIQEGAILI